jgi:hypothetical protein
LTTLLAAGTDANATIRAAAGQSEIVIKTTARTAGAIDSFTWNEREFIKTFDHGRQLQSASNLDCGTPITAETLSDGPGEIPEPVVLAVPGGSHAMGICAPPQPVPNTRGPTFGRFRFVPQKAVKLNCVFRVTDKSGLKPSEYSYHMFVHRRRPQDRARLDAGAAPGI